MQLKREQWMARANEAALGGGGEIEPEPPIFERDTLAVRPVTFAEFDPTAMKTETVDTDPMSDEPYERENEV